MGPTVICPSSTALSNQELVTIFSEAARDMGAAVLDSNSRRANHAFERMDIVDRVLRSRGRAAHMALSSLLADKDRFVRYYGAKFLLPLIPDRARPVIEENAKFWFDAIAGDAGMTLLALDRGLYKRSSPGNC